MLAKRIIPCLDVRDGRVVKGVNFVNIRDAGDPVELAKYYSDQGADEIVFLDITATSDARDTVADVVERTAAQVFVPLTVGGGIRTLEDFQRLLLEIASEHGSPQQIERRSPIEQLLYRIWQDPSRWWTVKEMAQFCRLDCEKFRNAFLTHTGSLPKVYVDHFKIDLAKHWLETFDWNLEQISRNLGYTDKFHFSRRFKALTGLAPDHFRRGRREQERI